MANAAAPLSLAHLSRARADEAFRAAAKAPPHSAIGKARAAAQSFEGVLVNNLLGAMTSGLQGEGPLGVNGVGGDTWRGLLVQELATAVTRAGGVGVAGQIYRDIVRRQNSGGA